MTTPAMNFVATCANANIPITGNKSSQSKHLKESGVNLPSGASPADVKERFAMLAWTRHAIANSIATEKWPSLLSAPLLTSLRTLYPIPAARADDPHGETDLDRLARVVAIYMPAAVTTDAPSTPTPTNGSSGINTSRDKNASQPLSPAGAGGSASASAASAAPTPTKVIDLRGSKRKFMMHDELFSLLPSEVYTALDANGHLNATQRDKMQKACRESAAGALYDPTVSAPFGHQILLALGRGAHFDPVKRGLALAVAGRSAETDASSTDSLANATSRRALISDFRKEWAQMSGCFATDHELSGTNVNRLWEGVSFVMQDRAAQAKSWGCPEVADACQAQYDALPPYRAALATAISRAAAAQAPEEVARSVNSAYLNLFLPFWWEHVLLRGRLDEAAAGKKVKEMTTPAATPAPAPAPPAPMPALPPAMPYPGPPPPYFPPPNFYPPLPAAAPGPPAAPAPWLAPNAPPRPAGPRAPRGPFVGRPISTLIVGTDIGLPIPIAGTGCTCAISVAFPGRLHRNFECPIKLHATFHQCPGWTPAGTRIPACWNGDVLTPACRDEWRAFAPTLPISNAARGADVAF